MAADLFHPLIERWFRDRFGEPTPAQERGWQEIATNRDTLIAAPTGSGKTLAAFLWSIDRLVKASLSGELEARTYVVYVSPLKALANDVHKNLLEPLSEIQRMADAEGKPLQEITLAVRSGDTPAKQRSRMLKHPPHILITTPESLYILLTAEGSRRYLSQASTLIIDEIHALAGDKRGAHLALSMERLDQLAGHPIQRIGLSATQKPIEEIARLLVGAGRLPAGGQPPCAIVDEGHHRELDLSIETTNHELGPIASHELWAEIYDRIVTHVHQHRTTLVFVNTRRQVERVAHQLTVRLGQGKAAAHHGSLSRRTRLEVEERLKSGATPVVVSTASLELGIDVGWVDLVCHVGAPRALGTLLQRVGRSGHAPSKNGDREKTIPKGILFPLTRDDLLQSAAAVRAVRAGELDRTMISQAPLDILAQQMVAVGASVEIPEEDLWMLARRAYPYQNLSREDFDSVLSMLAEGVSTRRGRRSAYLHHDRVNGLVRGRRGARLAAITGGGAIPDTADYDVIEEPQGLPVGKVNEDFAIESMGGDIFLLGNQSWRIRRVEAGKVRVEDARGAPPTIPFWVGEAPARTKELSEAVGDLRNEIKKRLSDLPSAVSWLRKQCGVDEAGAQEIVAYVSDTVRFLGEVPSHKAIIAERFFDEAGGMQLVVHAPFGGRINRAWCLALRKRFCVRFDFELQAAATDDGFVLSLGEHHSFPLEAIFSMLGSHGLEHDLVQALLASPMFENRWRWNATRALAVPRMNGGRKVPMQIQRMRANDLLAACFPEQVMCQTNRSGPVEIPDHPLVKETVENCLHEAMDLDGLKSLLAAMEGGEIRTLAVETKAPSPMCHEILNSSPYTFLDDAPLEERRTRAVSLRRIDPDLAGGMGALDPSVIDEVRAQSWPDVRDPDELHDALLSLGFLPVGMAGDWTEFMDDLIRSRRATVAHGRSQDGQTWEACVAAERIRLVRAALPEIALDPEIPVPPARRTDPGQITPEEAVVSVLRGWLECVGPITACDLSQRLGFTKKEVEGALAVLEAGGAVLQGRFTESGSSGEIEWCDRRLLARIHQLTIGKLRREIEPVSPADLLRFLLRWQHVHPGSQLHGPNGIVAIIRQLQGLEVPAPAWERDVLPARIAEYNPSDLETLCLSGRVVWARLRPGSAQAVPNPEDQAPLAGKRPQVPTRSAPLGFVLREDLSSFLRPSARETMNGLSATAHEVARALEAGGASFLTDIVRDTGRLPSEVEGALWELVASGLVTADGIAGLRLLLSRGEKRGRHHRAGRVRWMGPNEQLALVGRWDLLGRRAALGGPDKDESNDAVAHQLLQRYGIVFRDLLQRENLTPKWREILRLYRRMEARGEIRGGRFVEGFVGEQFALAEAVETLREVRRKKDGDETVIVCAADPLNMVGILTPGGRVPSLSNQVIVYRNGAPIEVGDLGAIRHRFFQDEVARASWNRRKKYDTPISNQSFLES